MSAGSFCLHCSKPIYFGRYRDNGLLWEPDYDPSDDPAIWRHENGYGSCISSSVFAEPRPEIVCLCGSTRFPEAFIEANKRLTLEGRIVLSVGMFGHCDESVDIGEEGAPTEVKVSLDELHKRKIDLADRVLVLNVDGYIGESTASEIAYAYAAGKPVDYSEPTS